MTTDFSAQFDDAFAAFFSEAAEATPKVRRAADPGNPAWDALPERAQALLTRAGIAHNGDVTYVPEGPAAKRQQPLDAPSRIAPTGGRNGDEFATARNLARQKFILTVVAATAANKGWIALEDIAALHIGCNVSAYAGGRTANDYVTTAGIAADLHRKLRRSVVIEGERLMIPNLKEHPKLSHLNKVANLIIGKVKIEAKSGFKTAAWLRAKGRTSPLSFFLSHLSHLSSFLMQNVSLKLDEATYRFEHTPSGEVRVSINEDKIHFLPFEAALRFAFKLAMQGARTV